MATTLTNVAKWKSLANLLIDVDTIIARTSGSVTKLRVTDHLTGGSGSGWSGSGTGFTNKAAWPSNYMGNGTCWSFQLYYNHSGPTCMSGMIGTELSGDGTWPDVLSTDTAILPTGGFTLACA